MRSPISNGMEYILGIIIFFFGSALGSFIAVIADRYNTGLPFFKGRSICFSCNTVLKNKDLIPVFSFLFLQGRCRYCQAKISISAFLVEILMGVLCLIAAFKTGLLGNNFQSIFDFIILTSIFATILLISVYDLKHFIIPDSFLVFFFIFSFLSMGFGTSSTTHSLISGIILTSPFLLIFLVSRGTWFGFGDVKYIAIVGFWLGLSQGLSAVILAFWIGAAFALLALCLKKLTPQINLPLLKNNLTIKSEVPFGPFISLGIIVNFCLNLDLFKINYFFGL